MKRPSARYVHGTTRQQLIPKIIMILPVTLIVFALQATGVDAVVEESHHHHANLGGILAPPCPGTAGCIPGVQGTVGTPLQGEFLGVKDAAPAEPMAIVEEREDESGGEQQQDSSILKVWRSVLDSANRRFEEGKEEEPIIVKPEDGAPPIIVEPDKLSSHEGHEPVITQEGQRTQSKLYISACLLTLSIYIVAFVVLFYIRSNPGEDGRAKAYVSIGEDHHLPNSPDTDDEADKDSPKSLKQQVPLLGPVSRKTSKYLESSVAVNGDDLISDLGISAMCVLNSDAKSGITKLTNKVAVPLIAIQSSVLQIGLLYFMATQLLPKADNQSGRDLPVSIIFISVYLHFLNCSQELPYSLQLFKCINDFHPRADHVTIMGAALITDAFVVPSLSFILGGLYLCTSVTIGDAILNAVAVAFVREIDNWILALNARSDFVSGKIHDKTVHIPVNRTVMRRIAWVVIFVPVLPVLASSFICWLGFVVMKL